MITAVTWLLVMVLEISVAMAVGFVLGRIWQIRCDLEQERTGDFTPPPIARIPVSCATMAAGRIYYLGHAWNKNIRSPYWKLRPRPAFDSVEKEYGPLPPNPSQAALAERYRLAQAAKVIRQLEQVAIGGKTKNRKSKQ
jgi:hypothetical protein